MNRQAFLQGFDHSIDRPLVQICPARGCDGMLTSVTEMEDHRIGGPRPVIYRQCSSCDARVKQG